MDVSIVVVNVDITEGRNLWLSVMVVNWGFTVGGPWWVSLAVTDGGCQWWYSILLIRGCFHCVCTERGCCWMSVIVVAVVGHLWWSLEVVADGC